MRSYVECFVIRKVQPDKSVGRQNFDEDDARPGVLPLRANSSVAGTEDSVADFACVDGDGAAIATENHRAGTQAIPTATAGTTAGPGGWRRSDYRALRKRYPGLQRLLLSCGVGFGALSVWRRSGTAS